MPLYDFDCSNGHRFEAFQPRYVEKMKCREEGCEATAHVVFVSTSGVGEGRLVSSDAVVIHRAPDGAVRFPGSANAKVPDGFERVELRTTAEKRRFEREINANERVKWEQSQEARERYFEAVRSRNRSELREAMKHMNRFGRDLARAAIEARNGKPAKKFEAGFYIEALSMDSSNRESSYDSATRGRK